MHDSAMGKGVNSNIFCKSPRAWIQGINVSSFEFAHIANAADVRTLCSESLALSTTESWASKKIHLDNLQAHASTGRIGLQASKRE